MSMELAFRALHAVGDLQPVGVSEIARALEAPKTSVYRQLRKLESVGWVRQTSKQEVSKWVLTAAPVILARKVGDDSNIKALALEEMRTLNERYQEAVHLAMPEGRFAVVVERLESPNPIRIHWAVGTNAPLHASANGRCLLAFSTGPQYDALFPESFERLAQKTVDSREAFLKELETVRAKGYAFVFEQLRDDIASVAAPIMGANGNPTASISLFFPSYRTPKDIDALGRDVLHATERVSKRLQSK